MIKYDQKILERFWAKVELKESGLITDCWNWKALKDTNGYGKLKINNKFKLAHRISYEINKDQIPKELVIDHLCRNTSCVNPDHLEVITWQENIFRSPIYNKNKTHCPQGHELTEQNLDIGQLKKYGQRKCRICKNTQQNTRNALKRSNYPIL